MLLGVCLAVLPLALDRLCDACLGAALGADLCGVDLACGADLAGVCLRDELLDACFVFCLLCVCLPRDGRVFFASAG